MCFPIKGNLFLDFPDVRQNTDYTCGASSLQAILYYYGFSYSEDQLATLLQSSYEIGTLPNNIIKFCRQLGFKVKAAHNMTMDQIKYYLNHKIPILVAFQAWNHSCDYTNIWDSGHYSVIIGIYKDLVIFEDPSILGRGYLQIDEFLRRWHDVDGYGKKYIHYGIMIYGKPIRYNSSEICPID